MTLVRSCVLPACPGRREIEPGAYACPDCQQRLTRQLGDIESYLAIVTPVPSRGTTGRMQPGYASTPPLRLDVVAMLDPRTIVNGDGPEDVLDEVPNVWADLNGWVRVMHEEHVEMTMPSWGGYPVLLRTNIGWICRQPWVDDFASDIARVHGALRRACGDAPARPFAHCPEVIEGTPCGGSIMMHEDGRAAQCRTCRSSWRRDQLLDLMLRVDPS